MEIGKYYKEFDKTWSHINQHPLLSFIEYYSIDIDRCIKKLSISDD